MAHLREAGVVGACIGWVRMMVENFWIGYDRERARIIHERRCREIAKEMADAS